MPCFESFVWGPWGHLQSLPNPVRPRQADGLEQATWRAGFLFWNSLESNLLSQATRKFDQTLLPFRNSLANLKPVNKLPSNSAVSYPGKNGGSLFVAVDEWKVVEDTRPTSSGQVPK